MKIGIICYPTHGGSGVIASELAINLANNGHEVHVVSYATPFRLRSFHQNIFIHEVEITSYPLFKYPSYALELATKLVDIVDQYNLEIIHAHYAIPHAASAYLAKQILHPRPVKMITTLHGTDITLVGVEKSFHKVIKFVIEQSDGVTTVSEYLRRQTIEEFGIEREIRVIHNFVDTSRGDPNLRPCQRDTFAPNGEKVVMHASNFRKLKRVDDVVHIFARILETIPAKLVLIGDGPEQPHIQHLVKQLGLSKSVSFLGALDQVEALFHCGDLFLLPSEQESFGLAALEALMCGVPVIGSDIGGLPELIRQGEVGYLYPVGDTESMAQSAIEILGNPAEHDRLKQAAKALVVERFDAKLLIPQYEDYYLEILSQK